MLTTSGLWNWTFNTHLQQEHQMSTENHCEMELENSTIEKLLLELPETAFSAWLSLWWRACCFNLDKEMFSLTKYVWQCDCVACLTVTARRVQSATNNRTYNCRLISQYMQLYKQEHSPMNCHLELSPPISGGNPYLHLHIWIKNIIKNNYTKKF